MLSKIKIKRELASIVSCNFYLVEAYISVLLLYNSESHTYKQNRNKMYFSSCPRNLRLINKHALSDLRLAITALRCYKE